MNKQRKVLITITYNEMGVIIDTKTEELGSSAQLGTDTISRQEAIDAIDEKSDEIFKTKQKGATYPHDDFFQGMAYAENVVKQLPPAQPEPCEDAVSRKDCLQALSHDGYGWLS